MKIKLRDITAEQYKKWNMCEACDDCIFRYVYCSSNDSECWVYHKDMFSDKFLDQEIEIDEPILTEKEREYLSSVIKPFRDRITGIAKMLYRPLGEKIVIMFENLGSFALPFFKAGTMYRGMMIDTTYTLEQLGL